MAAKKVTVSVGLVSIAARLEKATDDESSGAHAVCTGTEERPHDPARVKMSVGCTVCDRTHSSVFGFTERAVERDGKLVVLTAEELQGAAGKPIKQMTLKFHPREKVFGSTVAAEGVHNMTPDKGGEKAYAALRDTLASHPDLVACTVWAPSTKNALWVLEVVDRRIVVSKRCWPEDVRVAPAIPEAQVTALEANMFNQLVEDMVSDFDLLEYADQARHGVNELIASRAGDALPVQRTAAPVSAGGDMLAALQASVDAIAKKPAPKATKKTAAKKKAAAPKKRAVKKTALPKTA